MESQKPNTGAYFKSLQILFFAMLAGQIFFGIIAVYVRVTHLFAGGSKDMDKILAIMLLFVSVSGFFMSNFLFKMRLQAIHDEHTLSDKLSDYRGALIIRYALLEAPAMFAIVAYLVTGNKIFMGIALVIILFFLSLRPTREAAVKDMELNAYDAQALEKERKDPSF